MKKNGFTLINVLVGTFLMLIVFLGIFAAYQLGLRVVGQSKNKITATALANRELEKIRNLPYESIGVIGGFPEGILETTKVFTINNIDYTIETRVDYIVDSADGIASPDDECPNDYKKAEVKISWTGILEGETQFVTDITSETLAQECAERGGILLVSVFDAYGIAIPLPLIEIKNAETDETIKTATPIEGKHFFSLAPAVYKVVVSKQGFSTVQTYGIEEIATPERPHPLALEGELTENSFSIDKLSSLTIETRGTKGAGYPPIHGVTFTLTGAKLIGTDSDENPVYKYSQNHATNGPGQIVISNLEWDSYSFLIITPDLDLTGIESPPGIEIEPPIGLGPDTSQTVRLILEAENSLLVTVQNVDTGEPIFSASSRLYNSDLGYDNTQYTSEDGETYFIPLEPATYTIEVEAAGYSDFSGTILILGDETKVINLGQVE